MLRLFCMPTLIVILAAVALARDKTDVIYLKKW